MNNEYINIYSDSKIKAEAEAKVKAGAEAKAKVPDEVSQEKARNDLSREETAKNQKERAWENDDLNKSYAQISKFFSKRNKGSKKVNLEERINNLLSGKTRKEITKNIKSGKKAFGKALKDFKIGSRIVIYKIQSDCDGFPSICYFRYEENDYLISSHDMNKIVHNFRKKIKKSKIRYALKVSNFANTEITVFLTIRD